MSNGSEIEVDEVSIRGPTRNSPCVPRLVLVRKNDGTLRVCVEYRQVN